MRETYKTKKTNKAKPVKYGLLPAGVDNIDDFNFNKGFS